MTNLTLPARLAAAILFLAAWANASADSADPALTQLALDNLHAVVAHNHDLPRLHAAEDLAALGEPDPLAVIKGDLPALATQPIFRIVLWRVRARQAVAAGKSMDPWAQKVVAIFFNKPDTSDRVNAAETLGKIRYNPPADQIPAFRQVAESGENLLAMHARWVLAGNGKKDEEKALAAFLNSHTEKLRGDAAYALRFRPHVRKSTRELLIATAEKEPATSGARSYLYASAMVNATAEERPALTKVVEAYAETGNAEDKYEAMNALALTGGKDELGRLGRYLAPPVPYHDEDADIRVAAANAILEIQRR